MSEFEYHHDGGSNYVNHQPKAPLHHQSREYQTYNSRNEHASHSELLDDGYVLFQSVQISIPILPFLLMTGFVLFVMGLRAIKYFQLSVNWHVITKSFKHQVILLSLFFQIPLLCFYLYSLIKFGKSDASLILILILNSIIGGMASFINEKSLGYFVIMLACFLSSLLVSEAHIKTILICLCFLVVALKIQKIVFQRTQPPVKEEENELFTLNDQNRMRDPSIILRGNPLNNTLDRNKSSVLGVHKPRYYPSDEDELEQHFQNNRYLTHNQPTHRRLHENNVSSGGVKEVHPQFTRDDHQYEDDIYVHGHSKWNWSGIKSIFSNTKWFNSKNQQEADILERRNVKLQVPERKNLVFENKPTTVSSATTLNANTTREVNPTYTPIYPSLSSTIPQSVETERSPRTMISPYLLSHSSVEPNVRKHQNDEKPRKFQTKENFDVHAEEKNPQHSSTQIAQNLAKITNQPTQFSSSSSSAFTRLPSPTAPKQRPPRSNHIIEEEEFIPTVSTFDQDEDDE